MILSVLYFNKKIWSFIFTHKMRNWYQWKKDDYRLHASLPSSAYVMYFPETYSSLLSFFIFFFSWFRGIFTFSMSEDATPNSYTSNGTYWIKYCYMRCVAFLWLFWLWFFIWSTFVHYWLDSNIWFGIKIVISFLK